MVNIRKIESEDTGGVKDLINDIMGVEFSKESDAYAYEDLDSLSDHYGGDRELFLVAELDGNIVGTVAIKEDSPDVALLRRIFVHKDHRGKGYGALLLSQAMAFCFKHNYKSVMFRGTDKMGAALQLCLKNGFEEQDVAEFGDFRLMVLSRQL